MSFRPDHLYIELLNKCNLSCSHCYLSAGPNRDKQLDAGTVMKVISDYYMVGGSTIAFSGGEPLLHPEIDGFLDYSARLGLVPSVVTNCTLLNVQRIHDILNKAFIVVSLDGWRDTTHDAIRGAGNHAIIMAALETIETLSGQERTIVSFTPNKVNMRELMPLVDHLASRQFRQFHISLLEQRGRGENNAEMLNLDKDGQVRLLIQLALLRSRYDGEINIEMGHLTSFYDRLLRRAPCDGQGDQVENTLRIAPGGQVYISAYTDEEYFCIGNIHENTLSTILSSRKLEEILAQSRIRAGGIQQCQPCPYWVVCGGGSPVRAFSSTGDLMSGDGFCEAKKTFLEQWYSAL